MEIIRLDESHSSEAGRLVAAFRCTLQSFKGIHEEPDAESGREEILGYISAGWPVFGAVEDGKLAGYIVCRIDEPNLWVEQIYVRDDFRRKGIASRLFEKAEELSASMGEDTVYNYVHPNNERMIGFLRSKGYTVLNMIEIRKPWKGEKLSTTVHVDGHEFDY